MFPNENDFILGKAASSASTASAASKEDTQVADNDRKRRAQVAAERKAKVMAQMNQMQKKFANSHQTELASMDTNEHVSTNVDPSGLENDKTTRYKAIGAEKSMPHVSYFATFFFVHFC